jgi:hypothetical protein
MWRLNVRKAYLEKVFEVGKFFLNGRHDFQPEEPLLLQIVKQDEPGRILGRVRGMLLFQKIIEDIANESVELYGIKWKYAIISNRVVRLQSKDWFNMEDVIGKGPAQKYYGQAEAVKLSAEDEVVIREILQVI